MLRILMTETKNSTVLAIPFKEHLLDSAMKTDPQFRASRTTRKETVEVHLRITPGTNRRRILFRHPEPEKESQILHNEHNSFFKTRFESHNSWAGSHAFCVGWPGCWGM